VQTARVLILDDSAGFRKRTREFLAPEPGITVVGKAGDGREAVEKAAVLKPDVALMDLRMGGMNGLDATRQIKERQPGCVSSS